MRIHVTQNDWRKLKKPKNQASKLRWIASLMGGSRWKLSLEDIGLDTSKPWGYRKSVFPHCFYRVRWWFPVLGKLNAVTTMKEFTIVQGNKKDVIQQESRNFRSQFTAFFMCVPEFFFGVVSIYFWLLAALGLLSDPWKPRLAGHPLQKDRENQVPRGSAASPEGWWNTRKPWVWSPLMEIFCVKNTAFHFVVWFPSWHLWLKCSVDASHDFRDQTKELLE